MFLLIEWRAVAREKSLLKRFKTKVLFVGSTIVVGLLCGLVRNLNSSGSLGGSVLVTAQSSLSSPNPTYIFSGLQASVNFILGGVYASGILIFFSVIGFLALMKYRSEVSNFLIAWVFVGCISILFAAKDFVFDRFLFLMPWVVLSSLGLFLVVHFVGSRFGGRRRRFGVIFLLLVFVFLVLLNFGLRYVFNINIW
jgi:hypothetical protein